jgi:hypothetical protein
VSPREAAQFLRLERLDFGPLPGLDPGQPRGVDVDQPLLLGIGQRGAQRGAHTLDRITAELEREGVQAFSHSYDQLIASIHDRIRSLRP